MKAYMARAMSGRIMADVVNEANRDRKAVESYGITTLDPVLEEGVKKKKEILQATYEQLTDFWRRDKEMIREANVVFDMTPWMKSEGVTHEIGYARYSLWKPIIRVYSVEHPKPGTGSVAYFEDDVLAVDLPDGAVIARRLWGTRCKRFIWRAKLLNRCLLKWIGYQIGEWK